MRPTSPAAFLLASALFASACAPTSPPTVEPIPLVSRLAYALPAQNPVVYEVTDSSRFDMQVAQVDIATNGTAEVRFDSAGDPLQAEIRFTSFQGELRNSAGGVIRADENGIDGPFQVRVSADGEVRILSAPRLSDPVKQVAGADGPAKGLFMRLPGESIPLGGSWTDTIVELETSEGVATRTETILVSAWVRDTVVDQQTLHVIESRGTTTVSVQGSSQGTEMRQRLQGTTNAVSLWDPARNLLVLREERGRLSGTVEMPGIEGTGYPVTAETRGRQVLRRVEPS